MQLETILYIVCSDTSITISVVLALLFWNRRNVPGAKCLSLMMGFAALWGLCDFVSDLSSDYWAKIFWDYGSYFGIVAIPVVWFIFSMQFTKNEMYLTRLRLILLSIIPIITILMVWTNDLHHLMISKTEVVKAEQITVLNSTFSTWFWVHATYSYLLLFVGMLLLVKNLAVLPKIFRSQSVIILTAILIPLFLNVLFTFKVNPAYPLDATIFSFTITGILCFIGMFRYKLLELIPAARNAVIEGMSGILIVLDNNNNVIDFNFAAKNIFAIKENNLIGKPVFDVLGERGSHFKKYKHILNTEEKVVIDTNDGKRYFDLRITPLFGRKNKVVGKYCILYDITALEEAIEDLRVSHKAAEDANKAKSQFLATMSHEIRTPLNGIIGITELLASGSHTDEVKEHLQTVQSCAGYLLNIINDILDFSKIEAGKMELEKTDFNLRCLLDEMCKTFSHKTIEKDITFTCTIDPDIHESLSGDPVRLKQILINLVGNAFKFTEKGKIDVTVKQFSREDQQVRLSFSVTDTGIGIPNNKIKNLFTRFEQVDSSTTRKYGGTGLGLAIVKSLVAMMGGCINVKSSLGEGSSFSFTIPFNVSENKTTGGIQNLGQDFKNREITVLLAEDNKVNQMLISKVLENKKIKLNIAANGKEVLLRLEDRYYDLILMDIQMPEMDGYETTLAIRKSEEESGNHIPIIALTANATEMDRAICMQTGMDDFLTKPIKASKLLDCIHKHVG